MKNEQVVCYQCGYDGYETQEVKAYACFDEDGQPIEDGPTYMHIEAYCPKCDSLISIESIDEENIRRSREAERAFYGLVSHEDLLKLPKKYGVPREAVNIILDLEGELMEDTVGTSLWEGEVPTFAESDRIKKALESPEYFLNRMDNAKDNLPDEMYERVRSRLKSMV